MAYLVIVRWVEVKYSDWNRRNKKNRKGERRGEEGGEKVKKKKNYYQVAKINRKWNKYRQVL